MTLAGLSLRNLRQNPLRLALTVLAAAVGVLSFAFLQSVIDLWYGGVEASQADRLIVRAKTSITQPLPLAHGRRIATIPGVSDVTYAGWFGGIISESQKDFFPNFFVDTSTYLRVFDEYAASDEQLAAFRADPCSALIGEDLAARFGWKPGDRIALRGTIYPGTWELTLRGVLRGLTPAADTRMLIFGYRCLNERLPEARQDFVGYFAVRVEDPARSGTIATAIDATFENSPYETRSESERAFRLGFVAMSSAIISAVRAVSLVVLAIILLVVANTIAMGVRERTVELSTLRALGYRPKHVIGFVLFEAAVIGALAAALGLAAAPLAVRAFTRLAAESFGSLPRAGLTPGTAALSAAVAILVSAAAGLAPALQAARLPVSEGLRRVA
jgi:putative ABC transport system permease protein